LTAPLGLSAYLNGYANATWVESGITRGRLDEPFSAAAAVPQLPQKGSTDGHL
jgi:hypothetical protein